MQEKYIQKLIDAVAESRFDAVLIAPGEELEFLFGYTPMKCERFQGMFVKGDGTIFYICNLLYEADMRKELPDSIQVYSWFDGDVMSEVVGKVLARNGLENAVIGVNQTVDAFAVLDIMDHTNVTFHSAKDLIQEIRIIKDEAETQALRDAAKMVDDLFIEVLKIIKPGITEKEVADFLEGRMAELGGTNIWSIVAFGPNASYPHYTGNSAILKEQDVVLMDYGCSYHGMCSDITRTVFVGEPTPKQRECYELVRRSNEEAEKLVKAGAWIPDIDRRSRDVLDEKGYAWSLINRLGHGIGTMDHEAPDIRQSNRRHLEPGMAFSIEPGIYLPGELGIRIEDIVMVDKDGNCEILNHASKELIIL